MLRHKGVFGSLEAVDRSKEELAVLRKYPDPVVAEFRRGGDFGAVISTVKKNRYVEIRAAVGAGKSTEIPLRLSKALGCVVIHTVPFYVAAQYLADYLMSSEADGDKFVYMDDLDADMPKHGVVLMSTPFFHARRASDAFKGVQDGLLYLDESHESDGWTAALRTLAPAMRSFRVVKATATAAPGVQLAPDLPSRCERLTYPRVDVSTWSANDRDVPWAASCIQTSVMMCIDRKSTRRSLAAQYADYGFTVRDCSDEDYAYFRETIRMLKDPSEGIVVVLVDYKFRSSLSIPGTGVFIDSCEVAVPIVKDNMPKVVYRPAYDFEVQQFLGRGGRLANSPAKLYRSSEPSPKMMCDLESLECDAANLLYRMMGFRPPLEFAEYPYFRGTVPMDIAAAMASAHPLRLYPEESRVPWINGHRALQEEKQIAAYAYSMTTERRAKTASCHTVADVDRRRKSSPPPVPRRFRSTRVDVDRLDEYRSSRESSPSAVFTLDTEVYDNISASRDASAERPKRIAKRVLEARAAEAAALERGQAEQRDRGLIQDVSTGIGTLVERPIAVGESAQEVGGLITQARAVVAREDVAGTEPARRFAMAAGDIQPMYAVLRDRERHGPDIQMGKYYHYHGMDAASDMSSTFLRGVDSVVDFGEQHNARKYVKGLPDGDKLYAMRALVDASNHSTAVAMGMQRLFCEVSGRPPDQWKAIVDHGAMMGEVEWMVARCAEEKAKVRVYHSAIPLFAKYALEEIAAPLELEQRVMLAVMKRFERAAVKKDPDKAQDYWQRLNGRAIAVNPREVTRYGRSEDSRQWL